MTCDRCESLQAEVEYLKGELGLRSTAAQIDRARCAFDLPPSRAKLLLALVAANGKVLTHAQALDAMPPRTADDERGFDIVKSHISRLRRKLPPSAIANVWGLGYRLTDAGLADVRQALA